MKHKYSFLSFLLCFLLCCSVMAQVRINGKVLDARTGEALAFVTISYKDSISIAQTDIDGKFSLSIRPGKRLCFSYVGYQLYCAEIQNAGSMQVKMQAKETTLKEVVVVAGENPADRLMRKVIRNKNLNNPEKLTSFRYTSYNKFIFTFKKDTGKSEYLPLIKEKDSLKVDSIRKARERMLKRTDSLAQKQHIFIAESVTEREFLYPELNKEVIKASRISGLKNPNFSLLASQFQSFSCYNTYLKVLDKEYLSPLSDGAVDQYFFSIEDTTYLNGDTIFVLSFKPRKNKNFDGLKGLLYINSDKYALQNVQVEPAEKTAFSIRVQQLYSRAAGGYWFPVQLNTDLVMIGVSVNGRGLLGIGRTYLDSIQIGVPIKKRDFDHIALAYDDKAIKNADALLLKYRKDTLDSKEKRTYEMIDSVGKAENLDRKIAAYEALTTGFLRFGYVQLDLSKLMNANRYERYRLGAGLTTSTLFSSRFVLGGYFAYGTGDQGWKYGASGQWKINRDYQANIGYSIQNDVVESAGVSFYQDKLITEDRYRNLLVIAMDRVMRQEAYFTFRSGYLQPRLYGTLQDRRASDLYAVLDGQKALRMATAGIALRYAFREQFAQQPGRLISLGTRYPIFLLQAERIMDRGSAFAFQDFLRVDAKVEQSYLLRNIGKLSFSVSGGWIDQNNAPLSLRYAGRGNDYDGISLVGKNNFETMGMNEFIASRYAQAFVHHNFGSLLLKKKNFAPELLLHYGVLYGDQAGSSFAGLKTAEKGYQEAGITVHNLFKLSANGLFNQGFGLGTFYRLGAYRFNKDLDNLYVKLAYLVSF